MENGEISPIFSFGDWVQRRRKELDLTQAELAKSVGCAVVTVKKIEQGDRKPSRQIAVLLSEHLAIPETAREDFLKMARGMYVPGASTPKTKLRFPAFLQTGAHPSKKPGFQFLERQPEIDTLKGYLDQAYAGNGTPVFILGDAGSGKTTLMAEFARRAMDLYPDLLVAGGQCNAQTGAGDPYRPFRDILGLLTGDLETNWVAGQLKQEQLLRIWTAIPEIIQALTIHGPTLLNLLIPVLPVIRRVTPYLTGPAEWLDAFQSLSRSEPSRQNNLEQTQVLEEVTRVFGNVATRHPLLLLLDDLQWIDDASLNLLFHLGRRLPGSRIMLVGAFRPGERNSRRLPNLSNSTEGASIEPLMLELTRQYGEILINLNLENPAEGKAFIDALIDQEPNSLGNEFRDNLYRHTRGQPLFAGEMLHSMKESGKLVQDGSGRWVESSGSIPDILPARVGAVIEQRLGRLNPSLMELLEVASVEGDIFTAEVVTDILGLDLPTVLHSLSHDLGQKHRLVQEQGEIQAGPLRLNRFQFRHLLFQEYLYTQLSPGEKRRLHGEVAGELEKLWIGTSGLPTPALSDGTEVLNIEEQGKTDWDHLDQFGAGLVHHFWLGQLWHKAAVYALQMGQRARLRYAMREAIAFFEQALQALAQQPDSPEELTFDAILLWQEAAFKFKPYEQQLTQLSHAEGIARRKHDRLRLIQALHWTANVFLARGLWTRAGPALTECLALAEELNNERLSVQPLYFKGLMTSFANPRLALQWINHALDLAHHYGDLHTEALAFATKGQVLAQSGEFAGSLKAIEDARQIVTRLGSPLTESDVDLLAAWACLAMGKTEIALELGQRSVQKAIATDNMDCICNGLACIGYSNLELQRIPEAQSAFEKGIERSALSGAMIPKLNGQAGLAMTRFMSGQAEAIEELEGVIGEMHLYQNEVGAANAAYMLGRCFLQLGALERANTYFTKALEYYRQTQLKPFLARTLMAMAELSEKQGRSSDALEARQEAEELINTLFD
jgi:transcriptional regulator with XRE-family HTH domain/tetratricopeptide (TPR) repeat protein